LWEKVGFDKKKEEENRSIMFQNVFHEF